MQLFSVTVNQLPVIKAGRARSAGLGRGCVETAIRAGAQAAAEDGSFSWGRFLVEMWAVKEGVFALAASSSSHIFPDGHHQFVSSQQIDDPAQVVPEDMQAHLRLDVL